MEENIVFLSNLLVRFPLPVREKGAQDGEHGQGQEVKEGEEPEERLRKGRKEGLSICCRYCCRSGRGQVGVLQSSSEYRKEVEKSET